MAVDNPSMGWFEKRRESDLRRSRARTLYDFEMKCREQGWGDPTFVYDEENDLFTHRLLTFAANGRLRVPIAAK